MPESVTAQAEVELAGGVEFVSDDDLETALSDANVPAEASDAILEKNEESRIEGLRVAMALLAILSLIALVFTRGIPKVQPGAEPAASPAPV